MAKRIKASNNEAAWVFEELEPRLLLSADPLTAALSGGFALDGLEDAGDADFGAEGLERLFATSPALEDQTDSAAFTLLPVDIDALADLLGISPDSQQDAVGDVQAEGLVDHEETNAWPHKELLFVDAGIADYEQLVAGLTDGRDVEVVLLDPSRNGIDQIGEVLAERSHINAVHIVSHGTEDGVQLGNTWLTQETLDAHSEAIAEWGASFTSDADLLFYGCNLAAGADGRALVEALSDLTGADVAASDDLTGATILGGDWELEYGKGEIETPIAFTPEAQQNWSDVLATFTVDTTADTVDANPGDGIPEDASGNTSLRAAIMEANAWLGADTIELGANTYTLSLAGTDENAVTGDLDISSDVTIVGIGTGETIIDGGGIDRVFDVDWNGDATLSYLTIQNGGNVTQGGGIRVTGGSSGGQLHLNNVKVENNTATIEGAGIFSDGVISLTDVEISGNANSARGGGLSNDQDASLTRVSISGNSANEGGGIYNSNQASSLSLTNVTISGNTATTNGGGIYTQKLVSITNVTLAFNLGGGGVYITGGQGDVELQNSILANNTGGNANVALTSLGYNIEDGNTAFSPIAGDQQLTDPKLGFLGYNGGPTKTHALQYGSSAIDAGNAATAPSHDQRGVSRDASPDIGAFELTVAQGPGGVGSGLTLWLKADVGVTTDTGGVSQWDNQVANNTLSNVQQGVSGERPDFNAAALNFNPVITFDGNDDFLFDGSVLGTDLFSSDSASVFAVVRVNSPGVIFQWQSSDANRVGLENWTGNNRFDFGDGADADDSLRGSAMSAEYQILNVQVDPGNPANLQFYVDGQLDVQQGASSANPLNPAVVGQFKLGQWVGGNSTNAAMDLAEVIVYNGDLSATERQGVDSYLAVKYGITLDQSTPTSYVDSSNYIIWNATTNAGYNNDIAGIGQDNSSTLNQSQSHSINSDAILTVSGALDQNNGEFLFWGNDNGTLTETDIGNPAGVDDRLQRIWKVDETGELGTTTLTFDLNGLVVTATAASDFNLILDTDTDFSAGTTLVSASSYAGGVVTFTGVDLDDGQFVALGTNVNDAPTLSGGPYNLTGTDEDTTSTGVQVSTIVGGLITGDADGDTLGLAIEAASGNGTWQYSTDSTNGTDGTWSGFGSVVGNSALLVSNSSWIRYVPDGINGENVAVTFHAWDGTTGTASSTGTPSYANPGAGGGSTAYSSGTAQASLAVADVNDAPTATIGPVGYGVNEDDGPRALGGVSVADTDVGGGQVAVTLTVGDGNLTLAGTTGLSFTGGANGSATMTFTATVTDANTALATLTYQPDPDFNGTDTLSLMVDDQGNTGSGGDKADSDTAPITVTPVNDPPVAANDSAAVDEGASVVINLAGNDTDPDNALDLSSITITSGAANGSLVDHGDGTVTYTHDGSETTADSFSYTIDDVSGATSNVATVSLTVNPLNDTPTSSGIANIVVNEDDPDSVISLFAVFNDAEDLDPALTYTIESNTNPGLFSATTVDGVAGTLTLGYAANQSGSADLTVRATDSGGLWVETTFTVTVNPVNDPPVAANDSAAVDEGASVVINLAGNDTDPDNALDLSSITITSGAANGSLVDHGDGTVTYTHDGSETTADSFSYTIDDVSGATSNVATVSLTVNPLNDTPTSSGIANIVVNEDDPDSVISLFAVFNDAEDLDPALTYTIESNTNPGLFSATTVDGVAGTLTLGYAANQSGSADLTVRATDSGGLWVETTFTVTVNPVNDPPVAVNDSAAVDEGASVVINLAGNDTDPDNALDLSSITITSGAANGSLVDHGDGTVTYTHDGSETTADSFSYTIDDVSGATSNVATVSLTVNPLNDTPTSSGIANIVVNEDDPDSVISLFAVFNDAEDLDPALTYTIESNTNPGLFSATTVDGVAGTLTLGYAANQSGSADLTVRATDSGGLWVETTFTVTVNPVNDPPVAANDSAAVDEGASVVINLAGNDTDPDNALDLSSITITSGAANGSLVDHGDGTVTYTHDGSETTADSFSYTIDDVSGATSNAATVSLTVNPLNDTPTSSGIANIVVNEDDPDSVISLFAVFNDAEDLDPALTYTIESNTNPGLFSATTVDGVAGTLTLGYAANQSGSADLTVRATDSGGLWVETTFTVTVNPVNDPPVAANDSAAVDEGASVVINLAGNDTDPDNALDLSSITITSGAANGSLVDHGDGTVTYTHDGSETTGDSFSYTIDDVSGATSNVATVSLTVNPVNDPPVLGNNNLTLGEASSHVLSGTELSATDADDADSGLTFTVSNVTGGHFELVSSPGVAITNFLQSEILSGQVRFVHAGGGTLPAYEVTVSDSALSDGPSPASITFIPVVTPPPTPTSDPAGLPEPPSPLDSMHDLDLDARASHDPVPERDTKLESEAETDEDIEAEVAADPEAEAPSVLAPEPIFEEEPREGNDRGESGPSGRVTLQSLLRAIAVGPAELKKILGVDATSDGAGNSFSLPLSVIEADGFVNGLDELRENVSRAALIDKAMIASTVAVSSGLSVGYVVWLIRGGVLMSTVLSSLPAWRLIDPLPVLAYMNRRSDDDDDESGRDESLESIVAGKDPRPEVDSQDDEDRPGDLAKSPSRGDA